MPCTPPLPRSPRRTYCLHKDDRDANFEKCYKEDNQDYVRLENWAKGRMEVNALPLSEAFCN